MEKQAEYDVLTKYLSNLRLLKSYFKDQDFNLVQSFAEKVLEAQADRELQHEAELKARQEIEEKKKEVLAILEEKGLSLSELFGDEKVKTTSSSKVSDKYSYQDENGVTHTWTGRGKAPKVFKSLKDKGILDNYLIK